MVFRLVQDALGQKPSLNLRDQAAFGLEVDFLFKKKYTQLQIVPPFKKGNFD